MSYFINVSTFNGKIHASIQFETFGSGVLVKSARVLVLCQASFLCKVAATVAVKYRLLVVAPLGVARHAVVADSALPALATLVHLVEVPLVFYQRLIICKV